jgi:uncharacterized membrane protein YeaQ/YmgE (transglycosylase-associated protein family)
MDSMFLAVVVGGFTGWTASLIKEGSGQSTLFNLIVGIFGAVLGSWAFGGAGVTFGTEVVSQIVIAAIGAVLLLLLLTLLRND